MAHRYDLDTFEGRTTFDEMVERYIAMDQDVADYDPEVYAHELWESLKLTTEIEVHEEQGVDLVSDIDEARDRTFAVARRVLAEEQSWRAATR